MVKTKARLVRIGKSRGVRLPKPLIEQVGLSDEVVLEVQDGAIIIRPVRGPRRGWSEAAVELAATGSGLLDPPAPTAFDDEEWSW